MGKVVVITGAGSGLGRAIARKLGADGDEVVLLGRTLAKLETVAAEIGANTMPVNCDIGDPDQVRAAFAQVAGRHGKVDVLINNAAMIDYATIAEASDAHILGVIATNLTGNILCSRSAINLMERGGHILNVTSEAVEAPYPHHVAYQATKGGVECMSRHLQDEIRPRGIRVTVVRAGPMYDEDYRMQASPEAAAAFHEACVERHIDLRANPVSRFESVLWVFRSLIDSPADMHIDTVRMGARHP